jgi:hypothetical protein
MTLAKSEVVTKIARAVVVLGLVLLVAEVHHLRVAVENVGLMNMGSSDELDRMASSLDRPLGDIANRMEVLAVALDRRRVVETVGAAAEGDSRTVTPAVERTRDAVVRAPLAVDWDARLGSIVSALERLDATPRVRRASLPAPQSNAREFQTGAVLKTIAVVARSRKNRSGFLMMTARQLLDRYGKPNSISFGQKEERGQVQWSYEVDDRNFLYFTLYDGRVIQVSGGR